MSSFTTSLGLLSVLLVACGGSSSQPPAVDGPTGNLAPPRVIPGGGIGDGAIDGVANVYVIDDVTRAPVAGAAVTVGSTTGQTDATGLFVAHDVHGAQTVSVKAIGYRSELWVGANGANLTVDVQQEVVTAPGSAQLSGTIAGFGAITVATNHLKIASVSYSQNDALGDAANNLATANQQNLCFSSPTTCAFTVTTRTGKVALIAAIYDRDTKGTADPNDDTQVLIGWATRTGLTVASGVNQTGLTLDLVAPANLATITAQLGTPPAALTNVAGFAGIDLGADGTLQLLAFLTPTAATVLAPTPAAFPAATYRLTSIATDGATATKRESFGIHRGLSGTTLAATAWLTPPSNVAVTRTSASFAAVAGAKVHSVDFKQGEHDLLQITLFDGSTTVMIPTALALPTTGTLDYTVAGIAADLDPTNFALDTDRGKLTGSAAQHGQL